MASPTFQFKDPWRRRSPSRIRSPDRKSSRCTMDAHPERPPAGPSRIARKPRKGDDRSNALTLSLSPRPPRASVSSNISPHRPSPARSELAPSPEMIGQRTPSVNMQSVSTASPDSLQLKPSASHEPLPVRSEFLKQRSPSAATVRGPSTSDKARTPPLTPFPPWISDSESISGEESEGEVWMETNRHSVLEPLKRHEEHDEHQHQDQHDDTQSTVTRFDSKWLFNSIMHGVILALQFLTSLAVFSALAWVSIWTKSEGNAEFWDWLWIYTEPCLGIILILCCGTLIAHEVTTLSTVALLYLQSAILILTTTTSLMLWVRSFEEDNRAAKSVLTGCNLFMWGLAFFGFVRSVVLWRVEVKEEKRGRGTQGSHYGTFVSCGGRANGVTAWRWNSERDRIEEQGTWCHG
ncbi:Fc.00g043220.m01.CDS01 [Cosmosporella sp. VM-42]